MGSEIMTSCARCAFTAAGALALFTSVPVAAQTSASTASAVAAAYDTYHIQPIWLRAGPNNPAVTQLLAVLQRAPFDGFAEGPQLAGEIRAAIAQAQTGTPADKAAAERLMSTAWVSYVQALKRPTPGMIYAFPILKPQGTSTATILLTAAAAPSLDSYLAVTSDLNPIYRNLRDTAWAEAQATGNLTPDPRLLANLDRARSIPSSGRFLLVDSGDGRVTLYENGQPTDSMKVIVGTKDLPTPLIASIMYYVTYNPYWHAPDHLVRKTIAPNVLHLGLKYFSARGYNVIDDWSRDAKVIDASTVDWKAAAAGTLHLKIRQDPGRWNSMGKLKFPFDNPQDIYLHDTPGKELFAKDERHLSNGCVRLEDAARLGRWLIGSDPVAPGADPETQVPLPKGVPIVLTYLTAQVREGKIVYLPDIYGWDTSPDQQVAAAH